MTEQSSFPVAVQGCCCIVAADGTVLEVAPGLTRLSPAVLPGRSLGEALRQADAERLADRLVQGGAEPCGPDVLHVRVLDQDYAWLQADLWLLPEAANPPRRFLCVVYESSGCPRSRRTAWLHQVLAMMAHRLGQSLPAAEELLEGLARALAEGGDQALGGLGAEAHRHVAGASRVAAEVQRVAAGLQLRLPASGLAAELLRRLVDDLRRQFPELTLHFRPRCGMAWVAYDYDKLREVFVSFVRDSLAMHPTGTPTVSIEADRRGQQIVVTYADDGPGVPEQWRSRMFEPFQSSRGGAGMGMAVALWIVEGHGGQIEEVGAPGEGIRLEVRLPAVRGSGEAPRGGGSA